MAFSHGEMGGEKKRNCVKVHRDVPAIMFFHFCIKIHFESFTTVFFVSSFLCSIHPWVQKVPH